jgi:hypothetical protein
MFTLLLYHAIRKTFDDFDEVYQYRFDGKGGEMIETDKELKPGSVVILKGINDYAILITKVWEEGGEKYFSHDSAEEVVVRARLPRGQE